MLFKLLSLITLLSTLVLTQNTAVESSQYWHERYHGILSMAAYGDYKTLCPLSFTVQTLQKSFPGSKASPWTILSEWGPTTSGLSGFNVMIPEMDKVVMVFKGIEGWEHTTNMTAGSLSNVGIANCPTCTAHQGALTAYLEAKTLTNDWEVVKQYVNSTGHQWSITGHAFGGMVAQIAALDLGWRGLSHWSHNHGSPRVFNPAAATVYNSLYQGEASQRTIANQDSVPEIIPESKDFTFVLEGFHIFGNNVTFGMNYEICSTSPTDPNCSGGTNLTDNAFYYTPIKHCGEGNQVSYNLNEQIEFQSTASLAFYATAPSSYLSSTSTTTSASSTTSTTSTSVPTSTSESTTSTQTTSSASSISASITTSNTASTPTSATSGSKKEKVAKMGLIFGIGFVLVVVELIW